MPFHSTSTLHKQYFFLYSHNGMPEKWTRKPALTLTSAMQGLTIISMECSSICETSPASPTAPSTLLHTLNPLKWET